MVIDALHSRSGSLALNYETFRLLNRLSNGVYVNEHEHINKRIKKQWNLIVTSRTKQLPIRFTTFQLHAVQIKYENISVL